MARGRGSSSASSILVEMVRLGTAPAAFVLRGPDEMLAVGSLVADELYDRVVPIVVVSDTVTETDTDTGGVAVETGDRIAIDGPTMRVGRRSG